MAKHSVYAASKVFGEEKFHVVLLFLSSRAKSDAFLRYYIKEMMNCLIFDMLRNREQAALEAHVKKKYLPLLCEEAAG